MNQQQNDEDRLDNQWQPMESTRYHHILFGTLDDIYDYGHMVGHDIAQANYHDFLDEDENLDEDGLIDCCLETESDHFRQFSPFEFYAQEFNQSSNPDLAWQTYETGVYDGVCFYIYLQNKHIAKDELRK